MEEKLIIRKARKEDSKALIDYTKIVGGESDNLTFGKEGIPLSEK